MPARQPLIALVLILSLTLASGCLPSTPRAPSPGRSAAATKAAIAPVATLGPARTAASTTPRVATATATQATPARPTVSTAAGDFMPLAPAECEAIGQGMRNAFRKDVTNQAAELQDYVSGKSGVGCRAAATGTGKDFVSLVAARDALASILANRGFKRIDAYQADGPVGTNSGFRRESALCLTAVEWRPAAAANCPKDQPVSACPLKPEQRLYSTSITCAQAIPATPAAAGAAPVSTVPVPAGTVTATK